MAEELQAPPPLAGAVDLGAPEAEPTIVPTVAAITQRFIVSGVNITPLEDDGSRVMTLHSRGGVLIEASLAPDVLAHFKAVLNDELPEPEQPEEAEADASD